MWASEGMEKGEIDKNEKRKGEKGGRGKITRTNSVAASSIRALRTLVSRFTALLGAYVYGLSSYK